MKQAPFLHKPDQTRKEGNKNLFPSFTVIQSHPGVAIGSAARKCDVELVRIPLDVTHHIALK